MAMPRNLRHVHKVLWNEVMRQVRREDTRSQSTKKMVEVNAYYQVFFPRVPCCANPCMQQVNCFAPFPQFFLDESSNRGRAQRHNYKRQLCATFVSDKQSRLSGCNAAWTAKQSGNRKGMPLKETHQPRSGKYSCINSLNIAGDWK